MFAAIVAHPEAGDCPVDAQAQVKSANNGSTSEEKSAIFVQSSRSLNPKIWVTLHPVESRCHVPNRSRDKSAVKEEECHR